MAPTNLSWRTGGVSRNIVGWIRLWVRLLSPWTISIGDADSCCCVLGHPGDLLIAGTITQLGATINQSIIAWLVRSTSHYQSVPISVVVALTGENFGLVMFAFLESSAIRISGQRVTKNKKYFAVATGIRGSQPSFRKDLGNM